MTQHISLNLLLSAWGRLPCIKDFNMPTGTTQERIGLKAEMSGSWKEWMQGYESQGLYLTQWADVPFTKPTQTKSWHLQMKHILQVSNVWCQTSIVDWNKYHAPWSDQFGVETRLIWSLWDRSESFGRLRKQSELWCLPWHENRLHYSSQPIFPQELWAPYTSHPQYRQLRLVSSV